MRPLINRAREILRLQGKLERDGFPRLQMLLIVAMTGAAGLVASFVLLQVGLTAMWLRYLVAFGAAYLAFLLLLWLWLRTRAEDYLDVPDLSGLGPSGSNGNAAPTFTGEGGNFGGGGASGSYGHPIDAPVVDASAAVGGDHGGAVGETLGAAAGADEFVIPLLVLVALGALLLSSLWVVYSAPALFAELLVDGVLAAGLYRRLRRLEHQHWLETAFRRTVWPFILTAIVVCVAAWGMSLYAPEAHSIGQVLAHAKNAEQVNNKR